MISLRVDVRCEVVGIVVYAVASAQLSQERVRGEELITEAAEFSRVIWRQPVEPGVQQPTRSFQEQG